MAYCTQTNLEDAMGQQTLVELLDDEQKATTVGDLDQAITDNPAVGTRMTALIAHSSAVIDGYLRARYSVPLTTTPAFITKLCVDLTLHAMFGRRPGLEPPESVTARYKDAMDALKAIRAGKADVGVDPVPAASTAVVAETDGPTRLFTEDTLKDF